MSPSTVYLITGAGRGIGIGLVEKLVSNPDNVIFAGLRDTNLASDHPLSQLIAKNPERIFLLRVSSASEEDNAAAAEIVKKQYGKVDVIIANAGVSSGHQPITTVTPATLQTDFLINTVGPLVLFQAFATLLEKSKDAKFVIISSALGQIEESLPWPHNAYGLSKAGANFIAKKIDQEVEGVTSFPIHPGMVSTDMARTVAAGMDTTPEALGAIMIEASASGVLTVVAAATKETHGGKFWSYDGTRLTY